MQNWLNDIRAHASAEILVYLIGSKVDLVDDREVEKETARAFCDSNGIEKYFETSSATGFNVEEVFSMAAKDMYVRDCVSNAPPTPQAAAQQDNSQSKPTAGGKVTVNLEDNKKSSLAQKKKGKGCC